MTALTAAEPVEETDEEKVPSTEEVEDFEDAELGDLEVILPTPGSVVIDGIECQVRHVKAREFFMLMGIVTNGMGPSLANIQWNVDDKDELQGTMMAAFLMAIPEAIDDFLRLVNHLVLPKSGDKDDAKSLALYLQNPEVEDLLPVMDAILENEIDSIWSLLGKARAYLERWKKTINRAKR